METIYVTKVFTTLVRMDLECEHVSSLGKKMSPIGRAVMEIFNFFFGIMTFGLTCTYI